MKVNQSLFLMVNRIKKYGVYVKVNHFNIRIDIDFKQNNFLKVKSFLYLLLNKFENSYFIIIEGLPYCLMPDASSHIVYNEKKNINYLKTGKCRQCKYIHFCPGWPKELGVNRNLGPCTVKDLPEEIVLEITQKCNLDCRLCFSQKRLKEISITKIKKIIDNCSQLRVKTIRFTGGEPLLYKHIKIALNYAKERNLYVILNTNATILDERIKKILKNYVDNVLISLQGFNTLSENNLTRGKFDFKEKIKNIIELNYLIPTVRIGTIISQTLVDNFFKYYYLIRKIGIKNWELYRPMTDNRNNEFRLSRYDLIKIMNYIKDIKREGLNLKIANPIPFCITSDLDLSSYVLLGSDADDGHRRMIFDAGGFFKPSYFINENLGTEIEKAWNNPFLRKIRSFSYLPEKCQVCFYLKWCKGGSRYWAKIINQDYFAPDPLMYK